MFAPPDIHGSKQCAGVLQFHQLCPRIHHGDVSKGNACWFQSIQCGEYCAILLLLSQIVVAFLMILMVQLHGYQEHANQQTGAVASYLHLSGTWNHN
jgi:hypothetical protein